MDVAQEGRRLADNEGAVFCLRQANRDGDGCIVGQDPGVKMHYDGDDILGVHVDGGGMVYMTLAEVETLVGVLGGYAGRLREIGW